MMSPDFLAGIPWLEFGRVRQMHTNGVLFLWLSMAQIGAFLYIVPKLCGIKPAQRDAGQHHDGALEPGRHSARSSPCSNGLTQGREYAELIWPHRRAGDGRAAVHRLQSSTAPILARKEKKLFVSLWYIMGTMIWMPTLYFVGNVMWEPILNHSATLSNLAGFPSGSLQGIDDVIWQWFYGHNVLGYWFTTSGVAITYYVVPVIIRAPLYSHLLSLIGFWSIAFFYGLVGPAPHPAARRRLAG